MINPFKALIEFISVNLKYRRQSVSMAYGVLKKTYGGTMIGWAWEILHVVIWVALYWFGISVGIRGKKPVELADGSQVTYLIWMLPGVLAWFFYRDSWSQGVGCVRKESHLVNKVVFPICTIPVFYVMSFFVTHVITLLLLVIIYLASGRGISIYFVQMLYYVPLYFVFCCVVTTFVSTLAVVSRDFQQLVKSITIAFFWLTPVLWDISRIKTPVLSTIIKANPYYYFVQGYRDSFLGGRWFFEYRAHTLYFLSFLLLFSILTAFLQKKLSPDFADVL